MCVCVLLISPPSPGFGVPALEVGGAGSGPGGVSEPPSPCPLGHLGIYQDSLSSDGVPLISPAGPPSPVSISPFHREFAGWGEKQLIKGHTPKEGVGGQELNLGLRWVLEGGLLTQCLEICSWRAWGGLVGRPVPLVFRILSFVVCWSVCASVSSLLRRLIPEPAWLRPQLLPEQEENGSAFLSFLRCHSWTSLVELRGRLREAGL